MLFTTLANLTRYRERPVSYPLMGFLGWTPRQQEGLHLRRMAGVAVTPIVAEHANGRLNPGELQSGGYGYYYKGSGTDPLQEMQQILPRTVNRPRPQEPAKPYNELITSNVYFTNEKWQQVLASHAILVEAEKKALTIQSSATRQDFVCGVQNAGKALITGYYIDPNGKENRIVRIVNLNDPSKKEGGNWSDDMQEAANALCFAYGVHPNLVGATPGKSQMNNSGSDKRELFTLKQALEKPYHDVMAKPYHVILHYNGWSERCTVDVPMLMLTTLDENKDAKKVSGNSNSDDNGDNNNQE